MQTDQKRRSVRSGIAALSIALLSLYAGSVHADTWSMGFWTPWAPDPVSDIDWGGLTHIVQVGAKPQTNGSLTFETNFASDAAALISAAHAHNVKVLLNLENISGANYSGAIANNLAGF